MTDAAIYATADRSLSRKRMITLAAPAVILAYLTYVFFAFDVAGLADRISVRNMQTLVSDTYSYKVHVTRDNRDGATSVSIEGERKGEYPAGTGPDWVDLADTTRVDLADGSVIMLGETTSYDIPGYGTVTATPGRSGVNATFPPGDIPDWINASKNRVAITTDAARLTITRNRTEVFRYFYGWELFFFTLDSPFHGKSVTELLGSGQYGAIWSDFWSNKMWRHADVAWALFETVLMAFLGTFGAAMIALPLGFLAAKNFTPWAACGLPRGACSISCAGSTG